MYPTQAAKKFPLPLARMSAKGRGNFFAAWVGSFLKWHPSQETLPPTNFGFFQS